MAIRKLNKLEFRYYEVPQGEPVLALLGRSWVRRYGFDVDYYHFHNLLEVGYCYDGVGDMTINYVEKQYKPGMFTFIPRNMSHDTYSYGKDPNTWEYLFIDSDSLIREAFSSDPKYANDVTASVNSRGDILPREENPETYMIIRAIFEVMRKRQNHFIETAHAMVVALLLQIADINDRAVNKEINPKSNCSQLTSALDFIADRFADSITIGELAEVCHMSETHFRRLFRESMNMTPIDYINMVRIQMACEYMKNSDETMIEIAHHVGYDTISTFNRNFKKLVGVSPYHWKTNSENYAGKLLHMNIDALEGWQ